MSCRPLCLASLVAGLLLLQAADFLLTWLLLSGGRADVYESNPLARCVLERGGWLGLAAFKLTITSVALAAVLAVARRRRVVALRLLAVLCAVMVGVNVYSGGLLASPDDNRESRRALDHEARLLRKMRLSQEFIARRDDLCDAVLDGRLVTEQATRELRDLVRHYSPLLCPPSAGRLPDVTRDDEMALYFDYHLHNRAINRGLQTQSEISAARDHMTPLWLQAR